MKLGTLSPCELAILAHLHDQRGFVGSEKLNRDTAEASGLYDHAKLRGAKTVHVHIFNIREKLGDGAVICIPGRGYTLGAPGVKAYRAHLAAQAAYAEAMA